MKTTIQACLDFETLEDLRNLVIERKTKTYGGAIYLLLKEYDVLMKLRAANNDFQRQKTYNEIRSDQIQNLKQDLKAAVVEK